VSRAGFQRARECEPRSDAERFWKLAYGRQCAWGGKSNMSGFSTIHEGQTYDIDELWRFHERLKGARLVTKDWKETLAECDGPRTLFFIDPPYVEEWDMESGIPPEDIAAEVAKLEGDYVIAYTDSARARRALRKVGRPFKMRFLEARHAGLWKTRSRLFVASCKLKKIDDVDWLDDDVIDVDKQHEVDFTLSWQFWKGQTVVRAAPSRQVWHLVLDRPGEGLDTWVLQADPLSGEERITAVHTPRRSKALLAFDGDVEPGQQVGGDVLNDTKATPSAIRIQDRGRAVLLDDQRTFKKVRFEGEKLRGIFTLTAEESGSDIWQLARGHDPGRAVAKAHDVRDIGLADGTVVEGVQVLDPARAVATDDKAGDRAKLAPLALFKPMKVPVRATNEFRRIDETAAFATPEALRAGILVDPKYNGFRFVLEKDARGRVLMFTEEVFARATPLQNYARLLPGVAAELESLPGPFVLDAEFLAFEGDSPRPRRELAEFRGAEAVDDAGVRLFVFRALYLPEAGNLTRQSEAENRRALDAFLRGRKLRHLVVAPHRLVHTEAELREAVRWAAEQPGSEGAMLKLASSTYSLGGENDAWAKLKLAREVRAVVYDRHPVKDSPGVYNFFGAVGPILREDAGRWKETVEVGGRLYAPVGKTFNARLDAKVGDVIRVEVTELLVDHTDGKQSVT
jgi:ATP-dependent DNA ligase